MSAIQIENLVRDYGGGKGSGKGQEDACSRQEGRFCRGQGR